MNLNLKLFRKPYLDPGRVEEVVEGEALLGVDGEEAAHELLRRGTHVLPRPQVVLLRVHPEVAGPDPLHDGHRGVVLGAVREERRAAGEQDVHDHAQAPQVAALVVPVDVLSPLACVARRQRLLEHLRRGVLQREAGRAHAAALLVDLALRLQAGEPEVHHLQLGAVAIVRQQQVLQLNGGIIKGFVFYVMC